jgi:hypothetical protein
VNVCLSTQVRHAEKSLLGSVSHLTPDEGERTTTSLQRPRRDATATYPRTVLRTVFGPSCDTAAKLASPALFFAGEIFCNVAGLCLVTDDVIIVAILPLAGYCISSVFERERSVESQLAEDRFSPLPLAYFNV